MIGDTYHSNFILKVKFYVSAKLSAETEDDVIGIYISGAEQFGSSQAERYHNNLEKNLIFYRNIRR